MTPLLFLLVGPAWGDDIRPAMESINARFLAAFNTPDTAAFPALYTEDAILIFHNAPPIVGRLFLDSLGLRAWPSLLRLNPTDYSVDNLLNRKIGGIDHVHAPSRVATLPSGPAFPSHRIDLYAAYYILPPLRLDGVHALPRCPREHILCPSVHSAVAKAIQTDYVVAIEESNVNFVNVEC
jgi:hypothetical protein